MNDYIVALSWSVFFLVLFVVGFWMGVNWQIERQSK
tara:strand:- start:2768 stop:2875 length:108 start_codon:yes stop_codon:yes gene_type:complete